MFDIISGLINNVFFILFPLFFYHIFTQNKNLPFYQSHKVFLTILFSISIILCILFPYQFLLGEEYRFDLRQIPIIIGALYAGYRVAFCLFIVSVITRMIMGIDEGFILSSINQLLIVLLIPLLQAYFFRQSYGLRVVIVALIGMISLTFNAVLGMIIYNDPILSVLDIWVILILNQMVFSAVTALVIEQIIKTNYIQQTMIKNEKLDMISHMAASISHEIRNPLQVIKGFLQFIRVSEIPKEKQLEYMELMEKEVESAEQIITDYLTFAKPQFERIEKINSKNFIENVLGIIRPLALYSNVNILEKGTVEDVCIIADVQKFKQCLMNITRNCIQSMEDGGILSIGTEVLNNCLVIEISDNGKGMTKEQILRLGEPYFSTKEDGTGLGMMVVYSIIKNMNGNLHVNSEVGKGTTFKIEIPIAESNEGCE